MVETLLLLFSLPLFLHTAVVLTKLHWDYFVNPSLRPSQSWRLFIREPITAQVLADLLEVPVRPRGSCLRSRGVWLVTVGKDGRVTGESRDKRLLPIKNGSSTMEIVFSPKTSTAASTGMANTVQQLMYFFQCSVTTGHLAWRLPCYSRQLHLSSRTVIRTLRVILPDLELGVFKATELSS